MTAIKMSIEGLNVEITESELDTPTLVAHALGVLNELVKIEIDMALWHEDHDFEDDDDSRLSHPNNNVTTNEPNKIEVPEHIMGYS